jgi:putative membrane protein
MTIVSILAPLLSLVLDSHSTTLADPAGQLWQVRDIRAVTALVGLFTVLPFWLVAIFRTTARTRPSPCPGDHRRMAPRLQRDTAA